MCQSHLFFFDSSATMASEASPTKHITKKRTRLETNDKDDEATKPTSDFSFLSSPPTTWFLSFCPVGPDPDTFSHSYTTPLTLRRKLPLIYEKAKKGEDSGEDSDDYIFDPLSASTGPDKTNELVDWIEEWVAAHKSPIFKCVKLGENDLKGIANQWEMPEDLIPFFLLWVYSAKKIDDSHWIEHDYSKAHLVYPKETSLHLMVSPYYG